MPEWDPGFVCKHPMPGFGCNIPENIFLGFLFYVSAIISCCLLIFNIKKSKSKKAILDQTSLFWVFLTIFQVYRGTVALVPFHWTVTSFKIFFTGMDHILMFIPMCLVILILFDLLFTYRNPGTNAIIFFRSLFILFLFTFLTLGIVLSIVDLQNGSDPDASLSLWCACTDLILAIFFALPAFSLLDAVTYPMVQPEDVCCVNFCKVGILAYVIIFCLRMLYNGTHYFGINAIQSWMTNQLAKTSDKANTQARLLSFFYYTLFDFIPSGLASISVYLFKKHDMMFNENPYYTRQSD